MNRSILRQTLRTERVACGEVLVARTVADAGRRQLPCPAAALVASEVARSGLAVHYGDATVTTCGQAVLFVTSYVTRNGMAAGLAAAANSRDVDALAEAERAVSAWSTVLRTRRVLRAATDALCPGARRALDMARKAAEDQYYVYGELPGWNGPPLVSVNKLADVPRGAYIFFPAHGVATTVRADAEALGLQLIDATCPLVQAAQAAVRDFAADGDMVAVIGRPHHAVTDGLIGQAPQRAVLVRTTADVRDYIGASGVSYVLQPGTPVEELAPIAGVLHDRYQGRAAHPDGWCYAASDRAAVIGRVARESELLLVIGDPGSADAATVTRLASGTEVQVIADACEIRPNWVDGAATVGLAETVDARPRVAEQVISVLSGLGPVSVAEVRQVTRTSAMEAVAAPAATCR